MAIVLKSSSSKLESPHATDNFDANETLMEVEVMKIEGLWSQKSCRYSVRCSVRSETKKVRCVVKGSVAELEKPLKFLTNPTSKLELKIKKTKLFTRKTFVGGIAKNLSELTQSKPTGDSDLQTPESKVVVLALADLNGQDLKVVGGRVTLRITQLNQSNAAETIHEASEKWQQTVEASGTTTNRIQDVSSTVADEAKTGTLVTFLGNLKPIVDVVDRFAEIHPYAKAAWSLFSGLSNTFTSQIDRDAKMSDLVTTMNDTYEFVLKGEPLQDVTEFSDEFKGHFEMMLKQTIECAYFIREYAQSNFLFTKRAIKAKFSDIDKTINEYKENFEHLKTDFRDSASLHTILSVHRVMEKVDDIGMMMNLNEITYAEGMRYKLESCCSPEIHQDLFDEVIQRADNIDGDDSRVFLLTGPKGCGKSSIAHLVASHFDGLHRLGSSFFCTRTKTENSVAEKLLSTIARDIADLEDQVKRKLSAVVSSNRSLCKTTSVKEQFDCFIRRPTEGLSMVGPMVIVIDSIDECRGDEEMTKEMMRILAEEIPTLPDNFRFFLTSRSGNSALTSAFTFGVTGRILHYSMLEAASCGFFGIGPSNISLKGYLPNYRFYSNSSFTSKDRSGAVRSAVQFFFWINELQFQ